MNLNRWWYNDKEFLKNLDKSISNYLFKHYIECIRCGALINTGKIISISHSDTWHNGNYCINCRPSYDVESSGKFYKRMPEKLVEVDVDGKEIK
jgi:hypothetical protein